MLTRRSFVRLGLAGAGLLALGKIGVASAGQGARAKRLLIVNLSGGLRSSAAFHAAPDNAANSLEHNPWGIIQNASAGNLSLGQLLDDHVRGDAPGGSGVTPAGVPTAPLDDSQYQLSPTGPWKGEMLPRLRELDGFSVIGTWNEMRGDHTRASLEEPTGTPDGAAPGILTRTSAGLAGDGDIPVPGFHLAPRARFGGGDGNIARYAPVTLDSPASLPGKALLGDQDLAAIGHDWAADDDMRARLDKHRMEGREGFAKSLIETFAAHRRTNRSIGARLAEAWMHVDLPDANATYGEVNLTSGKTPLSNAMLYEVAKVAAGGSTLYGDSLLPDALNWMLAARLLQLGSRAVTIEMGGFDFHSGETTDGPALYSTLGRLWAALGWLLARIPEEGGNGSMLDNTLVVTMSDFGRDRGMVNGFNGGEGSDHGVDASCFYLAHAVMGAGVVPNRVFGAAPLDTFDARTVDGVASPRQLLATMLSALGLDHRDPTFGFDDVADTIPLWG